MGKGTRFVENLLGQVDVVESNEKFLEIEVEPNHIKALMVRLTLTNTVAGGGGAAVAVEDNPMSFIKNIRLFSPKTTMKNVSGINYHYLNRYEKAVTPAIVGQLSGSSIADAAYNQEVTVTIPMTAVLAALAETTELNSNKFASLRLGILWGAAADLVSNNTLSNLLCEVYSVEKEPETDEDVDEVKPILLDSTRRETIAGANDKFTIDLPEKTNLKTIFVLAYDDGRNDALINNIKVIGENGGRIVKNLKWKQLKARNQDFYGISAPVGVGVFEFDEDGDLQDVLNTIEMKTPKLEIDHNAKGGSVAFIDVVTRQIVTPIPEK